jgi:hypothetical protein
MSGGVARGSGRGKREGEGLLFGWKIGGSNFIFGGIKGYSVGKLSRARKKPPTSKWTISTRYRVERDK